MNALPTTLRPSKNACLTDVASIGIYLTTANRMSYLIVKTLLLVGCRVYLHSDVTLAEIERQKDEPGSIERAYFSWLFTEGDLAIVTSETDIPKLDALLLELAHLSPKSPEILSHFRKKARIIVGWNPNQQEQDWWFNLKSDLATVIRGFPCAFEPSRTIVGGGRTWLRPISPFHRAVRQGYFVNPRFLQDSELRHAMFADNWTIEERRPFRLLFSGNPEPPARRAVVARVEEFLLASPMVNLVKNFRDIDDRQDNQHKALWMVRSDPNDPQWATRDDVIPPKEWPTLLGSADFSLCPPGYERKTHRVIESLLRGTIPIFDCPIEFDLGLKDGINCLVVKDGNWVKQVERALKMENKDVQVIRQSIQTLRAKYLTQNPAGRHWLRKCGLMPEQ